MTENASYKCKLIRLKDALIVLFVLNCSITFMVHCVYICCPYI